MARTAQFNPDLIYLFGLIQLESIKLQDSINEFMM